MKLHSDIIDEFYLSRALQEAKVSIASDVRFVVLEEAGSRQRKRAYVVRLGTDDKDSYWEGSRRPMWNLPGWYAATRDEWGYFIAELFDIDPDAIVGTYRGRADFRTRTDGQF